MVVLYVRGNRIGTLADNTQVLVRLVESGESVEFRTDAGQQLGRFVPGDSSICPWDTSITAEELQSRRSEQGGKSLEEIWKRLGVR